jgi:hypothetical protein
VGARCQPVEVAAGLTEPRHLALSSTHAFFHDSEAFAILSVPLAGGPTTVVASERRPQCLAFDGTYLYWRSDENLMRISPAGGLPTVLLTTPARASGDDGRCMALSPTHVYWISVDVSETAWAESATLEGDDHETVANGLHYRCIAADANGVYWVEADHGIVEPPPAGSDEPAEVVFDQDVACMALDAQQLYWTTATDEVRAAPRTGGEPVTLASGLAQPRDLAVGDNRVYWANTQAGSIVSTGLAGGEVETHAAGQVEPGFVAVDETCVYWLTTDALMKVAK